MSWARFLAVMLVLAGCAGPASYTSPVDEGGVGERSGGNHGTRALSCDDKDGGVGGTGCPAKTEEEAPQGGRRDIRSR
jgi:hypothetical protein